MIFFFVAGFLLMTTFFLFTTFLGSADDEDEEIGLTGRGAGLTIGRCLGLTTVCLIRRKV